MSPTDLRRRSRARHPHFNVARARAFDPASTLTAMDIEGIDVAVMYGTRGRQILCHDDLAPDYAAALARAYNNWAADYCKSDPRRLKFAAQIAMHDVPMAVAEARRCVIQLGAVAVIGTPNPVNGQHLHDEACEPLWDELERLDVPIGFHPTGTTALRDDAGRKDGSSYHEPLVEPAEQRVIVPFGTSRSWGVSVMRRRPWQHPRG